MGFNFEELDDEIRKLMLEEIELDIQNKKLFLSPRLNHHGQSEYPALLKKAVGDGNEEKLANNLNVENYWEEKEPRRTKNGVKYYNIPYNANSVLAEGEFNRFYIRAICIKAIADDLQIEIYRAKEVQNPRSESGRIIGQTRDPNELLNDLRENIGLNTVLRLPPGPNSGLSIRFKR